MIFRFHNLSLDTERRELRDQERLISLTPKAFDVLCYLIEHRARMVTKAELLDAFWSTQVSEAALQKTISLIRKALAQAGKGNDALKTYHGLGVRFVAPVEQVRQAAVEPDRQPVALREQRLITALCVRAHGDLFRGETATLFLDPAKESVERYDGRLLRMTVDGFTVSFGLNAIYEDGARRAAHCALDLKALAARLVEDGADLRLSMGIHTGAGDVSDEARPDDWAPPGTIEQTATRTADLAGCGDIVISAAVQDQLRDEVESTKEAGGYRLIRIAEMQAGVPARPRKSPASFVGRVAELGFLNHNLELVMGGTGQGLALSGPAGIGKTRLVSEFLAGLDAAGCRHIKLQCLPGLCNSPGAPIVHMCRALFPTVPDGTLQDDVDAALLHELREDPVERAPVLQALSDHQRRLRSYALVNRMLGALCATQPLVIVIEDTHWIDATSQQFLDAMMREIDAKRLMVLITTRPTDAPALAEGVLQLSPLGHADSLALLQQNIDVVPLPEATAELLVQRAAGNPFFIEELALAAQVGGDPSHDLPDTVQAVIAVRIGALELSRRMLIYIIAVIGPPAARDLIEALTGLASDEIEATLDHLLRHGFLQVEAGGYAFRHMLIHDTAYAMVAPEERQRLHGEIARLLESAGFSDTARPETLALHHQEAGQTDAALTYWTAASRDALHRSARQEAIAFARGGLKLIDIETRDASKRELDLQLCLASALGALRGYGALEVGEAYNRARVLNGDVGSARAEMRIFVGLWIHAWVRGHLTEALSIAQRLKALCADTEDTARHLQAEASLGQVLVHQGEVETALAHLQAGLRHVAHELPATAPAQNASVACACYAAWATSLTGALEEAHHYVQLSERLSTVFENPFAEAIHHALCSEPMMFMGDAAACLALADRAVTLSRAHSFDFWLGTGLVMRGWALSQMQQPDAAREAVEEGIAVFEATGAQVQLANWYGLKAEIHLAAQEHEDGVAAAEHALQCAHRAEDFFFVPRIHATLAQLHRRRDAPARADEHARESARLAGKFKMGHRFVPRPTLAD